MMISIFVHGRYWTWEKIVLLFCVLNLIYIPAILLIHPNFSDVIKGLIPSIPISGFTGDFFLFFMANIGTTIAPWMIFFQQSSVVDKGMTEKDISFGKFDTAVGAFFTVVVAIFVRNSYRHIALQARWSRYRQRCSSCNYDHGQLPNRCLCSCHRALRCRTSWGYMHIIGKLMGYGRGFWMGPFHQQQGFRSTYVLCLLFPELDLCGHSCYNPRSSIGADNSFRAGGSCYSSSCSSGFSATSAQQ